MTGKIAGSRITIEPGFHGETTITIPPGGVQGAGCVSTGFLCFWLCGWAAGEFFAVDQVIRMVSGVDKSGGAFVIGFLLFWLTGWTVGGLFAGAQVVHGLMIMFGSEQWTFEFGKLTRERRLWGIRLRRSFPMELLTTLELADLPDGRRQPPGVGRLRFKFGKRVVYIAPTATDNEQQYLADQFRELAGRCGLKESKGEGRR
ncbi:MAG: hypothetical protein AUJ92_16575 [Armatimonadetes bacterium CG2_30_59_28]|nr:hypothetical protein [Armatimonadota bacterium]OIO91449.1 MAG: hypothetical protein AUJ92_16575 [Armatimonadetes bacterium CG2_30_59_28]PIU60675.1 MAG: hypothetical protein COS85_23240 [Armatimonadetes bacterium CG07_land_8_20_14_0_80_59_28]